MLKINDVVVFIDFGEGPMYPPDFLPLWCDLKLEILAEVKPGDIGIIVARNENTIMIDIADNSSIAVMSMDYRYAFEKIGEL